MGFLRAVVRWFLPYRDFIDRCWDLTERKSRGKAVFIYFELLFIGASFDWAARFPFDRGTAVDRLLRQFPPSLFMAAGLVLWVLFLRKPMPVRGILSLAVVIAGGYHFGAWVALLPLIHLMQQPLKDEGEKGRT